MHAQVGKYPIKNFTPEDYLAGIQNIDFAQNRDMNLFVANNLGVLSFNGSEWKTYALNTGKKQRSLAFDEHTGRLYVGSQGDFGYFEGKWNYVSLVDEIPEDERDFDEVWNVFIFNSDVYFCTFQAIFVFDGQSIKTIRHEPGLNKSFFTGNKIFTQSATGKLFEVNDLQLTESFPQKRRNDIVAGIIPKDEGILVFYNSGAIEFSGPLGVEEVFPELQQSLEGKYVNHVTELSDTRLVITTQQEGIYFYDLQSGAIENISIEDGLQTNACLKTFQDHTGNLWVGMQNGIALIDINSASRLINEDINLQGSGYEAFETDEGTYYTTSNGIYFLANNAASSVFLSGTEGPAYGMQIINNKLYAGHHTGLFILENGRARRRASTDGLWLVRQLRSNPGYAVGGTYSGLFLFRFNENDELEGVGRIGGFNESSRFFEEDRKGRIWVGQFYKGLYQLQLSDDLKTATVNKISDLTGLPIDRHLILSRIDDEIYLGTEKGIYRLDQTTDDIVEADNFSEVIGKNWVYFLAQDNQKHVHVYTENLVGFFKQVSKNNYAYIPSSLFLLRNSFNNDLLNVSRNISNGVVMNANEGFIYYYPQFETRLDLERKPIVKQIYNVGEDSILFERLPFRNYEPGSDPISISQGTKIIQFKVESFNFKGVNNAQFRYFLKGFDDHYSEWSNTVFKEYNNIGVGDYEFYVQTLNNVGELVTSDPIFLRVSPPFYKSILARFIYLILALVGLYVFYRLQRKYYKSKEIKLEEDKKTALAQKQFELKELKEEQVKSELRHVNNLLAASTMNLVVKNEFMENIKEEIKSIKVKGDVAETRKSLDRLVREIDSTLKVQEDWKQFEHHFDRVHGDFLTRLTTEFTDLTPGEQKLCAFLRLNMDTKEIANLMGVSLRGVEVARYRLRKKLGLDTHQNLSKFVLEY
ncbi:hypothetical protein [Fulvivirga sedimenti]|uniref:HTH luxR-type domain-containing protein n=1 Tax=Fulvivirga sedimenti TaxID=2879465 RepID=A0A9X1HM28_9BACT|nr:hypothetical protein [Fulvivirga sedimenti]MCA6074653.1 hypothetical protein [Fulvivirga sedimenti]MCA6075830.1 hypothetical protein [Fulvivirga sedimenti]MCA6076958.1 hypothetical protein [Fulvivirga sedimenti]